MMLKNDNIVHLTGRLPPFPSSRCFHLLILQKELSNASPY